MTFWRNHFDKIFLSVMSILGIALVFYATSTYGAGLPTDGMRYLSVSENLLSGVGFFDYDLSPLVWFPPLYPVLIASISYLTRIDIFIIAWVINAVLWGVNLFLSAWFLRKVFGRGSIYFYLGVGLVFLSPSSIYMHTNILTEPLFLTLTLLFFFAASDYIERQRFSSLIWMCLLAILASLLRYAGFSHIAAGSLIVVYAHRQSFRRFLIGILLAFGYGVVSFLPIAAWIYFHNYLPYKTYWGSSSAGNVFPLENFLQALRKVFYWFVPYRPISRDGIVEPLVFLAVVTLIILVINRKKNWLDYLKDYLRPEIAAAMLFALVNFAATTYMAQTNDHRSLGSDRYYALLLVPILILIFLTLDRLILPHIHLPRRTIEIGLVAVLLAWSVLPISRFNEYLRLSLANGESSYNLHNFRKFHESEIIAKLQTILAVEPNANIYSNMPAPIWLITRKNFVGIPANDKGWTKDEFKTNMAGWPYDKPGYLIWFEPDIYELVYPPKDLYLIADMKLIYEGADGSIFYISQRSEQ